MNSEMKLKVKKKATPVPIKRIRARILEHEMPERKAQLARLLEFKKHRSACGANCKSVPVNMTEQSLLLAGLAVKLQLLTEKLMDVKKKSLSHQEITDINRQFDLIVEQIEYVQERLDAQIPKKDMFQPLSDHMSFPLYQGDADDAECKNEEE